MVSPVASEQAGFERQQRQRVGGPHGVGAQALAAVSAQAGGQVDRQHRCAAGIQPAHRLGHLAIGRAVGTQAQQRVDGQIGGLVVGLIAALIARLITRLIDRPGTVAIAAQPRRDRHPGLPRLRQRLLGIGRQPAGIAEQADPHRQPLLLKMAGGHQPIAAVVARPGRNPDPPRLRCDGQRQPGNAQAGGRHQRVGGGTGQRRLFNLPAGRAAKQRPGLVRRQYRLRPGGWPDNRPGASLPGRVRGR